jgi:uncharacterized protein (DUF2249 family)
MATTRKTVKLDVREDLRAGREPFSRIMSAVAALQPDEDLLLVAPFKPEPLLGVLENRGFQHQARETASGDWEVRFSREQLVAAEIVEVDARGLEPPQPLVKILESLAALPAGAELLAHTDRRPMHLYSQLEQRGFTGQSEEQSDGSFLTHIRRA